MEFEFNVNDVLPETISRIECESLKNYSKHRGRSSLGASIDERLLEIIDQLGKASAKSQQLPVPITTADKQCNCDHVIYIIKDREANRGQGCVIGLLKIGRKKLFVHDKSDQQLEVYPVSVLDFYVHESTQRKGFGRQLFDHMLKNENVSASYLAIDRPSPKFLSFLAKHYSLTEPMPQINYFTIFPEFFQNDQLFRAPANRRSCSITPVSSPGSCNTTFLSYPYATTICPVESSPLMSAGSDLSGSESSVHKKARVTESPQQHYSPSSIAAIALGYSAESFPSSRRRLGYSQPTVTDNG